MSDPKNPPCSRISKRSAFTRFRLPTIEEIAESEARANEMAAQLEYIDDYRDDDLDDLDDEMGAVVWNTTGRPERKTRRSPSPWMKGAELADTPVGWHTARGEQAGLLGARDSVTLPYMRPLHISNRKRRQDAPSRDPRKRRRRASRPSPRDAAATPPPQKTQIPEPCRFGWPKKTELRQAAAA